MAPEDAPGMWELLMDKGQEEGLIPCGLGARDTLRAGGLHAAVRA